MNPQRITFIMSKLTAVWQAKPEVTFGYLIEQIENESWDVYFKQNPTHSHSTRLMNLPDWAFEFALDKWMNECSILPNES